MHNWKAGDKARVKYTRTSHDPSWKAGIIVTILDTTCKTTDDSLGICDCSVELASGYIAFPMFDQLEPIIKRPLTGTWDNIEYITKGWNPSKEKVT